MDARPKSTSGRSLVAPNRSPSTKIVVVHELFEEEFSSMGPPHHRPVEHNDEQTHDEQTRALAISRSDRDRALEAMQALEAATGAAGLGRDSDWRATVIGAFRQMQAALADQTATYEDPSSLMAQVALDDPRLRTLVRQLHHRWSDLEGTAQTLADELHAGDSSIADVREQVRWLMTALHHHRAREADIIFQALQIDITTETVKRQGSGAA
jgi:hypothetical protein